MIPADLLAALRVLVDPARIRLLGSLSGSPASADALAAQVRRPLGAVHRDLDALESAGLVERRDGGRDDDAYTVRSDRIGALAAALAALERSAAGEGEEATRGGAWPHGGERLADTEARLGLDADQRRVLRAYLEDGRLTTIPARGRKRDVVLRFLLERVFTEDRAYTEQEVNERLAAFHPDVAALRRYLVDSGLAVRPGGQYRRVGQRPPGDPPTAER